MSEKCVYGTGACTSRSTVGIIVTDNREAAYGVASQVADWSYFWRQAEAEGKCDAYGAGEWQSSFLRLLDCTVEQREFWFAQTKRWRSQRIHFFTDPASGEFLTEAQAYNRRCRTREHELVAAEFI